RDRTGGRWGTGGGIAWCAGERTGDERRRSAGGDHGRKQRRGEDRCHAPGRPSLPRRRLRLRLRRRLLEKLIGFLVEHRKLRGMRGLADWGFRLPVQRPTLRTP